MVPRCLLLLNEFDGSSTISLPSNDFHGGKIILTLQGLRTQNDPLRCWYHIIEMYEILMEDFTPLNKVGTKLLPQNELDGSNFKVCFTTVLVNQRE